MIKIIKQDISPAFGRAVKPDTIYINPNLPRWVQMSVVVHELYHLDDETKNQFWREVRAILAQLFMPLLGGLVCISLSFTPSRLKFYFNRIFK